MNAHQFSRALAVARFDCDLSQVDDSTLYGCGLPGFEPVTVTIEMVAKFLRWQCVRFNGELDPEELESCRQISRRRFILAEIEQGICPHCGQARDRRNDPRRFDITLEAA